MAVEVTKPPWADGPSGLAELLPSVASGAWSSRWLGGLLTFHPEPTGQSAHGNIVTS